jgi:transposase
MQDIVLPDTIEGCHNMINQFILVTRHQQMQLEDITSRFAELEARLKQNSSNSSRPPSSNFGKNSPKQTNKPGLPKEKKEQGGQKDHKGNTLLKVEKPDSIIQLSTPFCDCGLSLDLHQAKIQRSSQVFDLPVPKLYVTEYQCMEQKCACGKTHLGTMPDFIHANVQYGPNVRAFTTLLSNACQLSHEKVSTLFCDLFGYDLNESTVLSNNQFMYESLAATEESIKTALLQSEVVHFDESGMKINKSLHWLHTACNAAYTYLFVHEKRGKKAHSDHHSILSSFKNWAIHDCFATYFGYKNAKHGLCNPHLLRELQFQIEQDKLWANQIHTFLLDLYSRTQKGTIPIQNIAIEKDIWKKMCTQAIEIEEILLVARTPLPVPSLFDGIKIPKKRGRKARGKALKLLDRLLEHTDSILAFAEFEQVPFSNNQAERDIRPIKTKLKISGCFRTTEGANRYARIQGFISTCRKNNLNVFEQLKLVAQNAFFYNAPFGC